MQVIHRAYISVYQVPGGIFVNLEATEYYLHLAPGDTGYTDILFKVLNDDLVRDLEKHGEQLPEIAKWVINNWKGRK